EQREVILRERGGENVEQAIIVEIPNSYPHVRLRLAIAVYSDATFQSGFLEYAVTQIQVQIIWIRIVGDENVQPAIAIEIVEHHSESVVQLRVFDASLAGDVSKPGVAIIVIEDVGSPPDTPGPAKHGKRPVFTHRPGGIQFQFVDVDIGCNVDVRSAVVIVIAKSRSGMPGDFAAQSGLRSDFRERAIA